MYKKNISLSLLLLLASAITVFAQKADSNQSENGKLVWSVNFGAGYAPLNYDHTSWDSQTIDKNASAGITADINATYMLSNKYGISVGLGLSSYKSQFALANYSDEINGLSDSDDMSYNLLVDATNLTEDHNMAMFEIPVKVETYLPLSSKLLFTGGLGFKLGIPISGSYELSKSNITTKAFYPDLNFMLEDYPEAGLFTNKTDWQQEDDINTQLNVSLLLEAGFAYPVSNNLAVSCKGYLSYGLTSAVKGTSSEYLVAEESAYNGLQSFLGDAKIMQVGVKVGVIFNSKK